MTPTSEGVGFPGGLLEMHLERVYWDESTVPILDSQGNAQGNLGLITVG